MANPAPKRVRMAPKRFGDFATERGIRFSLRPRPSSPERDWEPAVAIVQERVTDGKTEYLVKFVGEEKLRWVTEVTDALLKRWVEQQHASQEAHALSLVAGPAEPAGPAPESPLVPSDVPMSEFFARNIVGAVQTWLNKRRHFSFKNRASTNPLLTFLTPLPVEVCALRCVYVLSCLSDPGQVFVDLFGPEVRAAKLANTFGDVFRPMGLRLSMPLAVFKQRFERFGMFALCSDLPAGWWMLMRRFCGLGSLRRSAGPREQHGRSDAPCQAGLQDCQHQGLCARQLPSLRDANHHGSGLGWNRPRVRGG
eukprot:m.122791 g.122791  ORF g.122791 m.122791 type:complete len:309 (+) comp14609_c0_seq1:225-1151(+)